MARQVVLLDVRQSLRGGEHVPDDWILQPKLRTRYVKHGALLPNLYHHHTAGGLGRDTV